MWIKNRDIHGKTLYQNIFASSALAVANIGGSSNVMLNVTVMQRNLTLGFGVCLSQLAHCMHRCVSASVSAWKGEGGKMQEIVSEYMLVIQEMGK